MSEYKKIQRNISQRVYTFEADSTTELDDKIIEYANENKMAIKTISLACQSYGYGSVRFYATVVLENIEEEEI